MIGVIEYINNLEIALNSNKKNISKFYKGKKGAFRLARELGYGLSDYTEYERDFIMRDLYNKFAVKFLGLDRFIHTNEFYENITFGISKADKYKRERIL